MEALDRANNYIDQLYDHLNQCENIKTIFNIIKYDDHMGIYLKYKCNNHDGFVITKIPCPEEKDLTSVRICVLFVDKCKQPKSFEVKFVELPEDDNINQTNIMIEKHLLQNSSLCYA